MLHSLLVFTHHRDTASHANLQVSCRTPLSSLRVWSCCCSICEVSDLEAVSACSRSDQPRPFSLKLVPVRQYPPAEQSEDSSPFPA
eukprot:926304-Rhodomonas_salina.5